jgi:peptidoglycan-associated lipoprotein
MMTEVITMISTPRFPRPTPSPLRQAALFGSLALLAATGCHHSKPLPNPGPAPDTSLPAPTASIAADPLSIELGQSVVINWRTTNATAVSIDGIGPVAVNGTQTVSPANSTNFHLVAKGDGGTTEANVRVTVNIPTVGNTGNENTGLGAGSDAEFHANVQDIFFDYDNYDIRTDAQSTLAKDASYLVQHPEIKVVIGGYCDERGSNEYNIVLGQNRAQSTKTALVTAGVAADRIRVISYGKEKPFCTDSNEQCWQLNRRAGFTIDR